MPIDKGKQNARWRRNKAAERARNSYFPRSLSDRFTRRVLEERDRRAAVGGDIGNLIRPSHGYFAHGSYERALRFAADIWAADTWLREEWGPKGAMPKRVAAWLEAHGAPHSYSEKSLPKMIKKARGRIEILEKPRSWNSDRPVWEPFDPSEESE